MQSHIYPTAPTNMAADTIGVPPSVANHEHEEQIHSPGKGKGVLSKVKNKARKLKDKIKKVTHSSNTHDGQQHEDNNRELEEADLRRQLGDEYNNDEDEYEDEDEDEDENNHALDHRDHPSDQTTRVEQLRTIGALGHQKQPAEDSDVELHGGRDVLSYDLLRERPEHGGNDAILNSPLDQHPDDSPVSANETSSQDNVRDGIPMTHFRNPGPPGTAQAVPTQYHSYGTASDPPISAVDTGYVHEGVTDDKRPMLPEELSSTYPPSKKEMTYNGTGPVGGVPAAHFTSPVTLPLDLEGGNLHGKSGGLTGPDVVFPDDLVKPNPAFGTASPISDKIGLLNDESDGSAQRHSGELSGTLDKPVPEHVTVNYEPPSAHQAPELHDAPRYNEKDTLDTPVLDAQEDKLSYRPVSGPGDLREEPYSPLEESNTSVDRDAGDLSGYASPMPLPVSREGFTENMRNDPERKEAALSAAVGGQVRPAHDEATVPTSREGNEKNWGGWAADKVTAAKDTVASKVGLGSADGGNMEKQTYLAEDNAVGNGTPEQEEGISTRPQGDWTRDEKTLGQWTGDKINDVKSTVASTVGFGGDRKVENENPAPLDKNVNASTEGFGDDKSREENVSKDRGIPVVKQETDFTPEVDRGTSAVEAHYTTPASDNLDDEKSWGQWTADKISNVKDGVASTEGIGGSKPEMGKGRISTPVEETRDTMSEGGRPGNERGLGQWTADNVNKAKDTIASTVGLAGSESRPEDTVGVAESESRQETDSTPEEDRGTLTGEAHHTTPGLENSGDEKSWGQWTAEKIGNVKETVASNLGVGGSKPEMDEGRISTPVEEMRNNISEGGKPGDERGLGQRTADNVNKAKDTIASTVGLGGSESRQETDYSPEEDRRMPTVEAQYTTPGSDNSGEEKSWRQWTVDKISNVKDTAASTVGIGDSKPEMDEGRHSTPVEETRNTISEGGRPGVEKGLGQWTADNVNKAKNTIVSTVGISGSETRPEGGSHAEIEDSSSVAAWEGDHASPDMHRGDGKQSWGQWTADKVGDVKDTVVSTVGSPTANKEHVISESQELDINRDTEREISPQTASGADLGRHSASLGGEGRIGTSASPTKEDEQREKESWGKWAADKVNNAKDTVASNVVLGTSRPTTADEEEVPTVIASENLNNDGTKDRTMSLTSDENYYDPNTLENNNVDVMGIFSNSKDDSQEAPSLTEYATGRLLGLKEAVASKLGYAASAAEPTDDNASHADSVVSPASNRVAEEGINEGEAGANGTGFTQKLLNTAAASRDFVAPKVGYVSSDKESGEADKELLPIEEKLQPGSSTDGITVDKNHGGEEGKSKDGQGANYKQKVLDATAAARDYVASSVGHENGKRNVENAGRDGEDSTTVLTGQQPGNVDEKRPSIASRLSPGEEDKALSQLITEKMSSTAAALKQKLISPRSAQSSAGAEAQQ